MPRSATTAAAEDASWLSQVLEAARHEHGDLPGEPAGRIEAALAEGTRLWPHQRRALAWTLARERGGPGEVAGSVLADEPGLGKTLTTICAVLANPNQPADADWGAATLIVAPNELIRAHWEREIARFVRPGVLAVGSYAGVTEDESADAAAMEAMAAAMAGADVVLSSVPVLRRELRYLQAERAGRRSFVCPLARVRWWRVVVDEVQDVEGQASAAAEMARAVVARHRFGVSGTPVTKGLSDLFGLLCFVDPRLDAAWYRRTVGRAPSDKRPPSEAGMAALRRLAGELIWRSTHALVQAESGFCAQSEVAPRLLRFSAAEYAVYAPQFATYARRATEELADQRDATAPLSDTQIRAIINSGAVSALCKAADHVMLGGEAAAAAGAQKKKGRRRKVSAETKRARRRKAAAAAAKKAAAAEEEDDETSYADPVPEPQSAADAADANASVGAEMGPGVSTARMLDFLDARYHANCVNAVATCARALANAAGTAARLGRPEQERDHLLAALRLVRLYGDRGFVVPSTLELHLFHHLQMGEAGAPSTLGLAWPHSSDRTGQLVLEVVSGKGRLSSYVARHVRSYLRDEFADGQDTTLAKLTRAEWSAACAELEGLRAAVVASADMSRASDAIAMGCDLPDPILAAIEEPLNYARMTRPGAQASEGLRRRSPAANFVTEFDQAIYLSRQNADSPREAMSRLAALAALAVHELRAAVAVAERVAAPLAQGLPSDPTQRDPSPSSTALHKAMHHYSNCSHRPGFTQPCPCCQLAQQRRVAGVFWTRMATVRAALKAAADAGWPAAAEALQRLGALLAVHEAVGAVTVAVQAYMARWASVTAESFARQDAHVPQPPRDRPMPAARDFASVSAYESARSAALAAWRAEWLERRREAQLREVRSREGMLADMLRLRLYVRTVRRARALLAGTGTAVPGCDVCGGDVGGAQVKVLFCSHALCAACAEAAEGTACPAAGCGLPAPFPPARAPHVTDRDPRAASCSAQQVGFGTKADAIVEDVLALAPGTKALVFSQFAEMLELLKTALAANGVRAVSLPTASKARDAALWAFKTDPEAAVLLLPLRATNSGMNITEATHVFLTEPCLYPALEAQAVARVRRLDQTRETFIHRYVVDDTLEEAIFKLVQRTTSSASSSAKAEELSVTGADVYRVFSEQLARVEQQQRQMQAKMEEEAGGED